MIIPLGTDDWQSDVEDVMRLKLHNMYITENPTSPDGKSRVSRPTLTNYLAIPTTPITAMWRQDGTFDGDWFVVGGSTLYRVNSAGVITPIGAVVGNTYYQFAGTADRVILVGNGVAYSTDGVSLTTVMMPDSVAVGSVAAINSFFLLSVASSDRFYWIVPGGTDPAPLDFASAERFPDPIISINILSDEIWFLGSAGPEVWTVTDNPDVPFIRIPARVYDDGCEASSAVTAVTFDNNPALIWVTTEKTVVIAQGNTNRISDSSIEELLKTATNLRAWSFKYNRSNFYVLTANEFTVVYDLVQKNWMRWDSYQNSNWRAHVGLQDGSTAYAGDSLSSKIYKLEEGVSDDGAAVIRELSGGVQNTKSYISCKSVIARVNAGWSPAYDFIPVLELRWSDDQGATYSRYRSMPMGNRGRYASDVIFRSVGKINRPGRLFEFRFSDLARFRLDYATVNEA